LLAHNHSDSPLRGAKRQELEARESGLFHAKATEMKKYFLASYGAQFC
jgi:hypothetical protein